MSKMIDFVSAEDKPALIAFSTPDWLQEVKSALQALGYKVHTAATHGDFLWRFSQASYQVVVLEALFCANTMEENKTLTALERMPMSQRRHATFVLLGNSFVTFNAMQAFQHSVHAVISSSEMFMLKELVEKAVAENRYFLQSYREAQHHVASSSFRS